MGRIFAILIWILIISCASGTVNKRPEKEHPIFTNKIESPELRAITEEFFNLSARNNIHFSGNVTIGFSKINRDPVIGECTIANDFREIEIDSAFWDTASWASKIALTYHEMAHCYCYRMHDFGNGEKYPENLLRYILDNFLQEQPLTPLKPHGFLDDNCPKSIMYPTILDDECFARHYDYYTKEMFARCTPF